MILRCLNYIAAISIESVCLCPLVKHPAASESSCEEEASQLVTAAAAWPRRRLSANTHGAAMPIYLSYQSISSQHKQP